MSRKSNQTIEYNFEKYFAKWLQNIVSHNNIKSLHKLSKQNIIYNADTSKTIVP